MTSQKTTPATHTSAGAGPPRRRRFGLLRHSLLLAGRSLTKTRRNPGVLGDAVLLPVIFLLLFVYLFGGAVAGSTHAYLQYIFPGMLVMTTILSGMMATGVNLNIDIKKGVFDRFRSLPIGRSAPLLGSILGDAIRYLLSIAALFAIGFVLGFRPHRGIVDAVAACLLTVLFGFCLSWAFVLAGVLIKETSAVQSVVVLTMFPLAFGTNMVAPAKTMPGWLQAFVNGNPVTQVVDAARGLLVGGPVAHAVVSSLAWSAALVAVFAPVSVLVYRRRTY
ncbi:ABC transporter permease [Catenulispora rubra]|uniref:ABC transporter permease n=1 Tax=Catenulispora rubra TaxID=280293 RepID=UPI001892830F|nr:ABC transporter permease [Catenulispora rubra]